MFREAGELGRGWTTGVLEVAVARSWGSHSLKRPFCLQSGDQTERRQEGLQ